MTTTTAPEENRMQLKLADEGIETLFGIRDENLRRIERAFDVRLTARGSDLQIEGDQAATTQVESLLIQLSDLLQAGRRFDPTDIDTAIKVTREAPDMPIAEFFVSDGMLASVRQMVNPRSINQYRYLKAMCDHDLVVSVGPAGTGKTYLAVAMAAAFLKEDLVRRIILARPAVEAGEKLGFLPGDLVEKVNPYLRPLYGRALRHHRFRQGRSHAGPRNHRGGPRSPSCVGADAQRQLRHSRRGPEHHQRADEDVPHPHRLQLQGGGQRRRHPGRSAQWPTVRGYARPEKILTDIDGIEFVYFDKNDVVRHRLVQKIIGAYADHDAKLARDRIEDTRAEEAPNEDNEE